MVSVVVAHSVFSFHYSPDIYKPSLSPRLGPQLRDRAPALTAFA
jgi:hypothetical protein